MQTYMFLCPYIAALNEYPLAQQVRKARQKDAEREASMVELALLCDSMDYDGHLLRTSLGRKTLRCS